MTSSRRLQLAAEASGTLGIAIRRWRRQTEATDFGQPTVAVSRWRVSALPCRPLPVPGVSRPRWRLELLRVRAGESADFEVEACDAKDRLALSADLATDRFRRKLGASAPPADTPIVTFGRKGRCAILALDDAARQTRAASRHAREQSSGSRSWPRQF